MFEFQQGPLFANLVLADQINRGMPKTQSALLQAMEGDEISVAHETFPSAAAVFRAGHAESAGDGRHVSRCPSRKSTASSASCWWPRRVAQSRGDSGAHDRGRAAAGQTWPDGERLLEMRRPGAPISLGPEFRRWRRACGGEQSGRSAGGRANQATVRNGSSPRGAGDRIGGEDSRRGRRAATRRIAAISWRRSIPRCGTG